MCITCTDRHAPNPKMCGKARVAWEKQAMRVVEHVGKGKQFRWIAETEDISVSTAHKLYKRGIKHYAPKDAKMQLSILMLQLEENYSDIREAIDSTTDPTELAKLFTAANDNIARRQALLGGDAISIRHSGKIKSD